jgi:hypothetical protein
MVKKNGLIIHQLILGLRVELGFTLEDFKKIRDLAMDAKDTPIHYVDLDLPNV